MEYVLLEVFRKKGTSKIDLPEAVENSFLELETFGKHVVRYSKPMESSLYET